MIRRAPPVSTVSTWCAMSSTVSVRRVVVGPGTDHWQRRSFTNQGSGIRAPLIGDAAPCGLAS